MSNLGFEMQSRVRSMVYPYTGSWYNGKETSGLLLPNKTGVFENGDWYSSCGLDSVPSIPVNTTRYYLGIKTTDAGLIDISYKPNYQKPDQEIYKYCQFGREFNLHADWLNAWTVNSLTSGEELTYCFARSTPKNTPKNSIQVDSMNAWVYYNEEWVSLKDNNPKGIFYNFGKVSDDYTLQTSDKIDLGYFRYRIGESGTGTNKRYIPSVSILINHKGTTAVNGYFDIPREFNVNEWLLLFCIVLPSAANDTADTTTYNESPYFSNTESAKFTAEYDLVGSLENHVFSISHDDLAQLGTDNFLYPALNDNKNNWDGMSGFTSTRGEMPILRKLNEYKYITAYNNDDTGLAIDLTKIYNPGETSFKVMSQRWHPYKRRRTNYQILYSAQEGDEQDWEGETRYLTWTEDERWELTDVYTVASLEKRLCGIIIQGAGGGSTGEQAGGGGGYLELLANAYNKIISLTEAYVLSIKAYTIKIYEPGSASANRLEFTVTAGELLSGAPGTAEVRPPNGKTQTLPQTLPYTDVDGGDNPYVHWYVSNSTDQVYTFDWDKCLAGVIAAVEGGRGGKGGVGGEAAPGSGNYKVPGVPNENLAWYYSGYPSWDSYTPLHYGGEDDWPGKFPGQNSGTYGGGGCSYMGEGGNGGGDNNGDEFRGALGGGAGGHGNQNAEGNADWRPGSHGIIMFFA